MHYHIYLPWLSDENATESFDDLFSALDTMADELNRAADFEYEGISALGDSEDYEGAYECFKLSNSLSSSVANLRNTVDQYENRKPRAPLYSGSDGDALLMIRAKSYLAEDQFKDLPLKYTPSVFVCSESDDSCENYLAYREEQN